MLALLANARAARSAEPPEAALWSRLHLIETAFRSGDAEALRVSFPSTAKVRVDLKDVTDGPASYGPGQLQVVFAQLFRACRTREFVFRKEDVSGASGTAFARGRWVRGNRGSPEMVDSLSFTLRREDGDWRIHEILSSR